MRNLENIRVRNRLVDILQNPKEFLRDGETLILVKDNSSIALYNDGENLCEVNGDINLKLKEYLEWLYDENEY